MADFILSLLMFAGGASWAFVCVMAGANHPTGEMPISGFLFGLAVAALGAGYFVWNLIF